MLNAPNLVRQARSAAGLTQAALAGRLGVSQSEIARLESREANPRIRTLLRAIEATGYTVDAAVRPRQSTLDESMLVANLRLTPAERLQRFARSYRSVASLARRAQAG